MPAVIVIQFVSVDGVMQDPDGAEGTKRGGWAFRYGPEPVAGDKFRLGSILETGAMLLGRKTWQHFAQLWPSRSDELSSKLNRMPKLVASRSLERVEDWNNSALIRGDVVEEVSKRKATQDLVVTGSASLVHTLMERDLVDEYRLLMLPTVLGEGTRLFGDRVAVELELVSAQLVGPAVLLVYRRATPA
jgi:dihydrofolate reductase